MTENDFEPSEILDQLQPEDTLVDRGVPDVLDVGYVSAEKWSPGEGFGTTAEEQRRGETLDQRVAQEVPDIDPFDIADDDGVDDGEVGNRRAGRLVDPNMGWGEDAEEHLVGGDVGIDGAGSSAEEAAVHIIDDPELDYR